MKSLTASGRQLAENLLRLEQHEVQQNKLRQTQERVNVVGAGGTLTAAYEQLRNAAENTEEHLLLQNAIRRFYRQLFLTRDSKLIHESGQELTVELTLAGYLPNDHLTLEQVKQVSHLAQQYYAAYESLLQLKDVPVDGAHKWTLDVLAVEVESVINEHGRDTAFVEFAYGQLAALLQPERVVPPDDQDDVAALLFAAIHEALLKSDRAVIRAQLLKRYQVSVTHLDQYIAFNRRIDAMLDSDSIERLRRMVDRQGAPFRVLRRMIEEQPDVPTLLDKPDSMLSDFEQQVNTEYARTAKRINRAIIRSVIFLIITKFLIGIAIEVPYDYIAYGEIIWMPLLINLFFPPLYMLALRATHTLPGAANTRALVDRMEQMLYGDSQAVVSTKLEPKGYSPVFSALYVISGLAIFAGVTYLLLLLQFSAVHIIIFFVFLCAASFLGFRLSRFIRELELVRSAQNGMTFVRDLVYLPFVVVGQWMSDKYSRVNIVTIILDMLIELPLKTVLRLVRQWNAFIDDRKDRI